MSDFMKLKFEYLLLSFWMFIFVVVIIHFSHHNIDSKGMDWALNAFSALLGALLGLITGHRLGQQRSSDVQLPQPPVNADEKENK